MHIIYEVNVTLNQNLKEEYFKWLKQEHIPEILALKNIFSQASVWINKEDENKLTIHYYALNFEALDIYFEKYAPLLREKGMKRFPEGLQIERRVLKSHEN